MSETTRLLKGIMKTSGWTQEQVAMKLGVSYPTLNAWINGKSKPRQEMRDRVRRLYLAQDVTKEAEAIYVTLVNVDDVKVGDNVILEKDYDNDFDDEAIRAYLMDGEFVVDDDVRPENDEWEDKVEAIRVYMGESRSVGYYRPMHVANSVNTVVRGTRSAGRIYDKFDEKARAQVVFVSKHNAIARVVEWNYKD